MQLMSSRRASCNVAKDVAITLLRRCFAYWGVYPKFFSIPDLDSETAWPISMTFGRHRQDHRRRNSACAWVNWPLRPFVVLHGGAILNYCVSARRAPRRTAVDKSRPRSVRWSATRTWCCVSDIYGGNFFLVRLASSVTPRRSQAHANVVRCWKGTITWNKPCTTYTLHKWRKQFVHSARDSHQTTQNVNVTKLSYYIICSLE